MLLCNGDTPGAPNICAFAVRISGDEQMNITLTKLLVMTVTSFTLPSCEHRFSIRHWENGCCKLPGTQIGCAMNPFQSGHTLSSSLCSEQVTLSVRHAVNLLELRAAIPPLVVLHPALTGDECVRPALLSDGFKLSRRLLNRLELLSAALQQVEELGRGAAEAPRESDERFLNDPLD